MSDDQCLLEKGKQFIFGELEDVDRMEVGTLDVVFECKKSESVLKKRRIELEEVMKNSATRML